MAKLLEKLDFWKDVVCPSILEQYRGVSLDSQKVLEWGCNNRWQACLKSIIDKIKELDDAACDLPTFIDFSDMPTGKHLDWVAGLVNRKRNTGESDEDFFSRFIMGLGRGRAGSIPFLVDATKKLSNDNNPFYMEELPAVFFVYTPGGHQLKRQNVKDLSPCAVCGLPGAAIQFSDGSFMGDYNKDVILAVADDKNIQ
ncbi:MAG: hypothetical protein HUK20_06090 [Fibrobacter sp.]|nr:hypothetical protein [Fibrobacter sp.]